MIANLITGVASSLICPSTSFASGRRSLRRAARRRFVCRPVVLEALEERSLLTAGVPDVLLVTNTNDTGSGSLRQALTSASVINNPNGVDIIISPSLDGQTLALHNPLSVHANGVQILDPQGKSTFTITSAVDSNGNPLLTGPAIQVRAPLTGYAGVGSGAFHNVSFDNLPEGVFDIGGGSSFEVDGAKFTNIHDVADIGYSVVQSYAPAGIVYIANSEAEGRAFEPRRAQSLKALLYKILQSQHGQRVKSLSISA